MNAQEVSQALAARAEEVAHHLLSAGRRDGKFWVAGSVNGEPGKSLKVTLVGQMAGLWIDYAVQDDRGDLLELWKRAKRIPFVEALAQAKVFLGVNNIARRLRGPPVSRRHARPDTSSLRDLCKEGAVFAYLTRRRGLSEEVLRSYGIRETVHAKLGPIMVFSITHPETGQITQLKYLAVARPNAEKAVWSSKDSESHLFGWRTIDPDTRDVVITEGEIDAMTSRMWGFPALSIPMGVNNRDWIDNDFEALQRFVTIYLAMDMDGPGKKAAGEVLLRLGRERCRLVELPQKDLNDCLFAGNDAADFEEWIGAAQSLDPPQLRAARDYKAQVQDSFWPKNESAIGTEVPFPIAFRVRPGEVTVWTGFSGHGKSAMLSQWQIHDMNQGKRVCIASMEARPEQSLAVIVQQLLGRPPASKDELEAAFAWLAGSCWLYDVRGSTNWREMLDVFRYAAKRYGCNRFIVDSLLFCGIATDDYAGQKEFVVALRDFADAHDSHVHLVAHSRKKDDESRPPGKLDVKGCSEITDIAHNGITVWRHKEKESKREEARMKGHENEAVKLDKAPDAQITFWKQRQTGEEPFAYLWFQKQARQFVAKRNDAPKIYLAIPS